MDHERKPRKMKGHRYCIALGCTESNKRNPDLAFFSLPKDENRRRKWLLSLHRDDLLFKGDLKYKSYVVCSTHFDSSQIKTVKHIRSDAVPSSSLRNQIKYNKKQKFKPTNRDMKTQTDSTLENRIAEYEAEIRIIKKALEMECSEHKRRKVEKLQRSKTVIVSTDPPPPYIIVPLLKVEKHSDDDED